jgi:hypothetical protein
MFSPDEAVELEVTYNLDGDKPAKLKAKWSDEAGREEAYLAAVAEIGQGRVIRIRAEAPRNGWTLGHHKVDLAAYGDWRGQVFFIVVAKTESVKKKNPASQGKLAGRGFGSRLGRA